jgi:uncharacterized protein (TIGR03435 family)
MMRGLAWLGFVGLASGETTEFLAADVHVSPHGTNQFARGGVLRGGRYELRTATMVDLIARAYGVDGELVVGGPNWLELDRFDVYAKAPADATPDDLKIMLRALLAERFKLVVHNETKPMPAWALTVGKHPALKKSEGSGETGCHNVSGAPAPANVPMFFYSCHNTTMAQFADGMRNMIGSDEYIGRELVVDQTGLEGAWDFNLRYTLYQLMLGTGEPITLFAAIEKQLGLKLERVKVPMAVIVVDSVNRTPTENAPGVTEKLGIAPPATDFEVAEVKLGDPASHRMRFQIQPGGRVNMEGVTLQFLIQQAWDITGDMMTGAPKWLETDRFNIVAKAPASGTALDRDAVRPMLRALLADRFKLATHLEDRPVPAYTLVAVKPKMKTADPASRIRFKESPPAQGEKIERFFTFQNMTMAQFAEQLQRISPGDFHALVLDGTKLDGAWDFTLRFSPAGMERLGRRRGGDTDDAASASDPSGAITLFEAVEKQLGLKLESQKRTMPVLVIDHVEQKPTEN